MLRELVNQELHYAIGLKKKTGDKLLTLVKNVEKNDIFKKEMEFAYVFFNV